MTRWRLVASALLLLVIGVPLAHPVVDLVRHPEALRAWEDGGRLLRLAGNTFLLVGGTLSIALPAGLLGAVLLYRTDLPGCGFFRWLTVLTLFIPLPLYTSAWQAALGSGGLFALPQWTRPLAADPDLTAAGIAFKPWGTGLGPAIWIHAVAGLPWVAWLAGQGLRWVERELEEDALLVAGPWWVLWHVTLRRAWPALAAAALWVALQTATEITVTDMMQVRTFAEEVYTQWVSGGDRSTAGVSDSVGLARVVAVNLPQVLFAAGLIVAVAYWWQRALPPLQSRLGPPLTYRLALVRWPAFILVALVVLVLVGVPLASLVWKLGLSGSPETWSATAAIAHLGKVARERTTMIGSSLAWGLAAGVIAAGLALVTCWLATEAAWFRNGAAVLMAVAWAVPGPVVGIGLIDAIKPLVGAEDWILRQVGAGGHGPLSVLLYYGPSPVPVVWAWLVRFFPCAVAVLWPVVRAVPPDLRDAARVDGAHPRHELFSLYLPLTDGPCLRAALAVAILSLGELSASKLVGTAGGESFAHFLFTQMHTGVGNDLAALCLILLVIAAVGGAVVAGLGRYRREW